MVAATQSPTSQRWSEGPADSVRQWIEMMGTSAKSRWMEDILVLPSDQVYRVDFAKLVAEHRRSLADITIVCHEVPEAKAQQFGIVKVRAGLAVPSSVDLGMGYSPPQNPEETITLMSHDESAQVDRGNKITSFSEKPVGDEKTMMSMDW